MARKNNIDGSSWSTALRLPKVLWAAMLASTGVYGGLILSGTLPRNGDDPMLGWVLFGVAMVTAVMSFALPAFFRRNASKLSAEVREEVDPGGQSMFRDAAPTRRVAADPVAVRADHVARRYTPFILSLALSEVPAITGLVSWMSSPVPRAACLVLVALSTALILMRFPSVTRWRADAEQQIDAVIP